MDWSGHRSITRNEGVPGSSPGVGFSPFAGLSSSVATLAGGLGYETGTSSDRFTLVKGSGDLGDSGWFPGDFDPKVNRSGLIEVPGSARKWTRVSSIALRASV